MAGMPDTGLDVSPAQSFEALVAEVYQPLQRYLLRRTGVDTANDVLGDVLLVMWRRMDDIPSEAPLPWCYGVARRCLANAHRKSDRQLRLVARLAAEPSNGASHAADSALGSALDEALQDLSDSDQELLRLWAWENLTPVEIACALSITPNATSIRLHRAIKKLKKQLLTQRKEPAASGHKVERQGEET